MNIGLVVESEGFSIFSENSKLEFHHFYRNYISIEDIMEDVEIISDSISDAVKEYEKNNGNINSIEVVIQDKFIIYDRLEVLSESRYREFKKVFDMNMHKKYRIDEEYYDEYYVEYKSLKSKTKFVGYTLYPKYYVELCKNIRKNTKKRVSSLYLHKDFVQNYINEDYTGIVVLFRYLDMIIFSVKEGVVDSTAVFTEKTMDKSIKDYILKSDKCVAIGRHNRIFSKMDISMDFSDEHMLFYQKERGDNLINIFERKKSSHRRKLLSVLIIVLIAMIFFEIYSSKKSIDDLNSELNKRNAEISGSMREGVDESILNSQKLISRIKTLDMIRDRIISAKITDLGDEVEFICKDKKEFEKLLSASSFKEYSIVEIREIMVKVEKENTEKEDAEKQDNNKSQRAEKNIQKVDGNISRETISVDGKKSIDENTNIYKRAYVVKIKNNEGFRR